MIPGNGITPQAVVGSYDALVAAEYTPLTQIVRGGKAIGDASEGRVSRIWSASIVGNDIIVRRGEDDPSLTLTATDALTVSLAFDNNMGVALAWLVTGGARLYYFDTITQNYVTRSFPGITSCRLAVDEPRQFYLAQSDVIFAYTRAGKLRWRQQRDRYDVERDIGVTSRYLTRMGLSSVNRLQWQMALIPPTEIQPAL